VTTSGKGRRVRGKVQPFEFGPSQKIDSGVADRWSKNAIFS